MAFWLYTGAAFATLLTACSTAPTPLAATDSTDLHPRSIEISLACADHAARRLEETNPIQLATLDLLAHACALPTDDLTLAEAEATLAGKPLALTAKGDTLTLFQIADGREPSICCSLQRASWRDLGDGRTYAARFHLRDLQSGMLELTAKPLDQEWLEDDYVLWRGADAPGEPILKPDLEGTLSDHTLYSPELGETRKLIIYQPRQGGEGPLPTLYLTDGDDLHFLARIIEPLIDAGEIAPLLIVGMPSGQEGIVEDRSELGPQIRNLDYLPVDFPGHAPSRFESYLAFVANTLAPWVEDTFPAAHDRQMRAVSGQSSGGGFSLNAGYRRPDVFGHAWPMSVGIGEIEATALPEGEPARFRISAGYYEPHFLRATQVSAEALHDAGYSVDTNWYAAGHMTDQWHHRLLENLKAVFPGPASASASAE